MTRMPIVPKTVSIRPKGLVDCSDITDILIYEGQERRPLYDQMRGLLKDGYLLPVARMDTGKKVFLMHPRQVLVADVLLRLREFSVSGHGPYDAAAFGLSNWKGQRPDDAESTPVAHIIREYEEGVEGWVFELWSFVNVKTGKVIFEGRVHHAKRGLATDLRNGRNAALVGRGCFAVDLTDALDRVHPRGKAKRQAAN